MNSIRMSFSLLKSPKIWYFPIGVTFFIFSCTKNSSTVTSSYNRFLNSSIQLSILYPNDSSQNSSLKINGDGNAFLSGGKNTQNTGLYKATISAKSINSLFNKLECSNFFDFHSEYGEESQINAIILFHFSHRGFTKNIIVYSDIPDELENIRKMIEEIKLETDKEQSWVELKE